MNFFRRTFNLLIKGDFNVKNCKKASTKKNHFVKNPYVIDKNKKHIRNLRKKLDQNHPTEPQHFKSLEMQDTVIFYN